MIDFSTFEIIGIALCVTLASVLLCIVTYACNLMWLCMAPFRLLCWCCKSMTYDEDDHGTCLGVFGSNYVV